eukprot:5091027-Pyramimonas_sp.AAC.1
MEHWLGREHTEHDIRHWHSLHHATRDDRGAAPRRPHRWEGRTQRGPSSGIGKSIENSSAAAS